MKSKPPFKVTGNTPESKVCQLPTLLAGLVAHGLDVAPIGVDSRRAAASDEWRRLDRRLTRFRCRRVDGRTSECCVASADETAERDLIGAWLSPRLSLDERHAADLGPLLLRIQRAVATIPGVGNVHIGRWGEGFEHCHIWFMARAARMEQLRSSFAAI